jgi:hypothetical protein
MDNKGKQFKISDTINILVQADAHIGTTVITLDTFSVHAEHCCEEL